MELRYCCDNSTLSPRVVLASFIILEKLIAVTDAAKHTKTGFPSLPFSPLSCSIHWHERFHHWGNKERKARLVQLSLPNIFSVSLTDRTPCYPQRYLVRQWLVGILSSFCRMERHLTCAGIVGVPSISSPVAPSVVLHASADVGEGQTWSTMYQATVAEWPLVQTAKERTQESALCQEIELGKVYRAKTWVTTVAVPHSR